jgi:hypothetical protein
MRAFLAHAKSDDDAQIAAYVQATRDALESFAAAEDSLDVVTGRDDFMEHAAAAGGWKHWPRNVIERPDVNLGTPYYDLIVLPALTFGKGTAAIVEVALEAGRPVILLDGETGGFKVVEALVVEDEKNYQSGYRAEAAAE